MKLNFTKMHGLGNDFVMIENMDGKIKLSPEEVVFLCDRHKGIGADGVILLEKTEQADCFMNYYNSDGSFAEMCGNGVRCTVKFFLEKISPEKNKKVLKIGTRAGIKEIILEDDGTFSVNMGKPVFLHSDFPKKNLELEGLPLNFVSVGNPHAVSFVNKIADCDLETLGPKIENDPHFPNKINVELVEKINSSHFKVAVWERGCGRTLACGTGACAVFAVLNKNNLAGGTVKIELPGGILFISKNDGGEIIMCGSAEVSFEGEVKL